MAFNIFSFMFIPREKVRLLRDRDAFVLAMAANQDFDHICNTAMFHGGCFADCLFDGRIDAQVQGRDFRLGHAGHCIVNVIIM